MPRRRSRIEVWATGENIRWDVRWVVKKGKTWHIVVKECGNDLTLALSIYNLVLSRGRHHVTLRSRNSAFPPPEVLRPYMKTVNRNGRKTTVRKLPLRRLNKIGQFWCPYCRTLREFVERDELPYKGPVEPLEEGLYCPMCMISHRDHHVRKWNPIAEMREYRGG